MFQEKEIYGMPQTGLELFPDFPRTTGEDFERSHWKCVWCKSL